MINPNVVEGQIAGGVVQGIGGVLYEHLAYDDDGNPLATTFMDYLLPTAAEVPMIEYGHIETPSPGPAATRASAKAARSARRRPSSTRWPTRSSPFGVTRDPPAADPVADRGAALTKEPSEDRDQYDRRLLRPLRRRRSTPTRTRCSAGCARRRRSTTTSSTTSTRSAASTTSSAGSSTARRTSPGAAAILELIKANIEMPPGVLIFEDPPMHTMHRGLLSRVFTPEEDERARAEDPRVLRREPRPARRDAARFDFVADLGAQMPMRVIGMLLGIPEQDQEAIRDHVDANAAHRGRASRWTCRADDVVERRDVRRLHRLARRAPVRRPHDRAAATPSSRTRRARRAGSPATRSSPT